LLKSLKIIDFGSSFSFSKVSTSIELTTPEYLAPDILEYLDNKTQVLIQGTGGGTDLSKKLMPWSIDVWSLGAILVEFVIGFPLWLSYKGRIVKESR
jgi:serine/threonine protein kinase